MSVLKNKTTYGAVKVFIRHAEECPESGVADEEAKCHCSKWLYEHKLGGKRLRRSLHTYSWAEAQEQASKTLKGFDPEIAATRQVEEQQKAKTAARKTIQQAWDLYYSRKVADLGRDSGSLPKYRNYGGKFLRWASKQFDFVDEVTTASLEQWQHSSEWQDLANSSQQVGWIIIRGMFDYLLEREIITKNPSTPVKAKVVSGDLVQGPYSDAQIKTILAAIDDMAVPENIHAEERKVYKKRLRSYVLLLLHTGCDLIDAALFSTDKIKRVKVSGKTIDVFRYKRKKTGVEAVIPIDTDIAQEILAAATTPLNPEGMPFRYAKNTAASDAHKWGRRIERLLEVAGVEYVILPGTDDRGRPRVKPANGKQFRHSFAVHQLVAGQRPEEVAKMLGHVDATMVRKHYAPWVPEMDEAHLMRVLDVRKKGKAKAA